MERQFPKNVRQVGNVSDEPKIYVEDYVDTYLNQLKNQAGDCPVGAFLTGEISKKDGQECVYITGAVQLQEMTGKERGSEISEELYQKAKEESEEYFGEDKLVGWFLVTPGKPLEINSNIARMHEKYFPQKNSVLIMKDSFSDDEVYFAYKYYELMQLGGHYVFYEKNPHMQDYMISTRRQIGVTPSEVVEDRAAKDFRSAVRTKMEDKEQRQNSRLVYATSVLLVVVVLAIGVSTVNNFDKMEAVQSSLESLSQSVDQAGSQNKTVSEETVVETGGSAESADEVAAQGTVPETSTIQEELSEDDYYVVKKGDTLDSISVKLYGDSSHVTAICKMNGLSDGNLIYIGQKLLLP